MTNFAEENLGKGYQFNSTPTIDYEIQFILNNNISSVFECATGTGIIPKLLRAKGFQGKYLGSDYSDVFLGHAKENNGMEVFTRVDLGSKIEIESKSYDCSIIHHGLDYVYPYEEAMNELSRITRGYVIFCLWQPFDDKNSIKYNEAGKWNVNRYEKKEWYDTLKKYFSRIIFDGEITEWNEVYQKQVYNHLFILKV